MHISITTRHGFPPQLMRAAAILRMGGAALRQFLAQHGNPCLATGGLPPLAAAGEDDDVRQTLRAACRHAAIGAPQRPLVAWLIECVNDDGFLELPDDAPAPTAEMEKAILTLQALAPAGVAARSAAERLLLLLDEAPPSAARAQARRLVADHWQWVQRKRWDKLPKRGREAAIALLESLPPPPIAAAAAPPACPDIVFARWRGLWRAQPAIGCSIKITVENRGQATLQQWRQAREIAAAVAARRRWVVAAAQYAADRQSAFFSEGAEALRPLPMQQAADALGVSKAMLSHIVSDKRAIFAGGEFALKSLYGCHTQSLAIRRKIQRMIAGEPPRRPLSDAQLCRQLQRDGLALGRRAVARHRQSAGLASAARRKRIGG